MTAQGTNYPEAVVRWSSHQLQIALTAAHHHAQRGGRRLHLGSADRDDLRQDILLAMLQRRGQFDPARGAWSTFIGVVARHAVADRVRAEREKQSPTFVPLDVDDFPAGCSATQQDAVDPSLPLAIERAIEDLPAEPRALLQLIRQTGDVADAQRASAQSCASFYRGIADLRFWLLAAGLRPPQGVARRRSQAVA